MELAGEMLNSFGIFLENMNTGNATSGGSSVPTETFAQEIVDLVPEYGLLGSVFSIGNHTPDAMSTLGKSVSVNVKGGAQLFKGQSEKTTSPFSSPLPQTNEPPTAKVVINQARYVQRYDVTDELQQYSTFNRVQGSMSVNRMRLQNSLRDEMSEGVARTIDAAILNSDNATDTTNINSLGVVPDSESYFLKQETGLRKFAIDNGYITNLSTIEFADFLSMQRKLSKWRKGNLMWIFEPETEIQASGLEEFKDSSQSGKKSTAVNGEKAFELLRGIKKVEIEDFLLTDADGKVDALTPANNVKGGALLVEKRAVQHGWGLRPQFKLTDLGSQGIQLEMWFDFGFGIVDPTAVGYTKPLINLGINATLPS